MQFQETVAYTVDWYRDWNERNQDMCSFTVDQIEQYCLLAKAREAVWHCDK